MENIVIRPEMTIDYDLLKDQKQILLKMIELWSAGPDYQREEAEKMDGLISIIDAIQDHAIEELGLNESLVLES